MEVRTDTERLREYRRMIVELLFAERNHICSVCVANGHCELQDLAVAVGMDHVRFDYLNPSCDVDISHERFGVDHNRCILCTRCVRVCDEIEGAHTWDVAGRGVNAAGHHRPEPALGRRRRPAPRAASACRPARPGAIFRQGSTVAEMEHDRAHARLPGHRAGEEAMERLKLATVWLGGCSGCHMSFLDLDECLIDLAERPTSSSPR